MKLEQTCRVNQVTYELTAFRYMMFYIILRDCNMSFGNNIDSYYLSSCMLCTDCR